MFVDDIINSSNVSTGTMAMYKRVFVKLGITNPKHLSDTERVIKLVNDLFQSDESKKIALNAICKVLEGKSKFNFYNDIRNDLKRKIAIDKSDNIGKLPMTYQELLDVPNKIDNIYDRFFVYMHVKYPLRLDYYNVPINRKDTNYMTYDGKTLTFYLNEFKNVKSMGKQVITYQDPVIDEYMKLKPEYLLYRVNRGKLNIFSSRTAFGVHLTHLFQKYTGKKITMNDIRKIIESHNIQNPDYVTKTNREKNEMHSKLLHKTSTALNSYNKLDNRRQ